MAVAVGPDEQVRPSLALKFEHGGKKVDKKVGLRILMTKKPTWAFVGKNDDSLFIRPLFRISSEAVARLLGFEEVPLSC